MKNNKDLLQFIFKQMQLLDKKNITVEEAKAQANLCKQANNSFRYELDRAKVEMQINSYNSENNTEFEIRDIELK